MKTLNKNESLTNISKVFKVIKEDKVINVEKFNLDMKIGTENAAITAFLTAIVSSLIGVILHEIKYENVDFNVVPLYQFGNSVKIKLNCIICVKVVHIIYVIYILSKKGMIKNERASNRRSYDYGYE